MMEGRHYHQEDPPEESTPHLPDTVSGLAHAIQDNPNQWYRLRGWAIDPDGLTERLWSHLTRRRDGAKIELRRSKTTRAYYVRYYIEQPVVNEPRDA